MRRSGTCSSSPAFKASMAWPVVDGAYVLKFARAQAEPAVKPAADLLVVLNRGDDGLGVGRDLLSSSDAMVQPWELWSAAQHREQASVVEDSGSHQERVQLCPCGSSACGHLLLNRLS